MKKDKTVYLFFGIFGIVGIILMIASVFMIISSIKFNETAVEIVGTISDIESYRDSDGDRHYRVYVDYEYEGSIFRDVEIGSYSSGMYEGKDIKLRLDPNNPGNVRTPYSNMIAGIIMAGMGVIFALIGIIPTIISIKKAAKEKKLRQQGRTIYAIVESVDVNYSYSVNGKHPFVVYCNYQDEYSGVLYKFKSDNLWTDPYPYLQQGSEIRVLVDAQDYSQYHVDVENSLQVKIVDYT